MLIHLEMGKITQGTRGLRSNHRNLKIRETFLGLVRERDVMMEKCYIAGFEDGRNCFHEPKEKANGS